MTERATIRLQAPADPISRATALIDAWFTAPDDADITIRVGTSEAGDAAVLVGIGQKLYALTANEANIVAKIAEGTIHKFGNTEGLDNLVLGLREGARVALEALEARDG